MKKLYLVLIFFGFFFIIGCSSISEPLSTTTVPTTVPTTLPTLNPKLEATVANDARVDPPDLKNGKLGTEEELKFFLDFISNIKYQDVDYLVANAYPMVVASKTLTTEETLKLLNMTKNIKALVLTKIESSNTHGGWSIYIITKENGIKIGHTGNLITCAFDDKNEWWIFEDPKGESYMTIYDFIKMKQTS